jgi:hypothetical protein
MTRREKVLATTLIVMMAVVGGGVLFHMFVYQPIAEVREDLAREKQTLIKAQNDLAQEEQVIENILHVNPRLSQWKQISLPPRDPKAQSKAGVSLEDQKKKHISDMQVQYDRFLSELLRKNGFSRIVITPRQPDRRGSPTQKGKEPVYERLAFSVAATGNLQALVSTLKEFHTTPLLQQVRSLTLKPAQPRRQGVKPPLGTLDVSLLVEALMVTDGEPRSTLKAEKPPTLHVLAEPAPGSGRNYDLMVKRNMFTGIDPAPAGTDRVSTDARNEVLRFVKLTMLCSDPSRSTPRWLATLYDQAKGPARGETKLNEKTLNKIDIYDDRSNPVMEAWVVKIDESQLVFKWENKFYRLRCGEFIYPAIRQPLLNSELRELGVSPDWKPPES